MSRRQLRLPSCSDEDDRMPSSSNPNPNTPLVISDDEFVDVYEPSPPQAGSFQRQSPDGVGAGGEHATIRPLDEFLRSLGLRLRPEWLASCASGLESSGFGFESMDIAGKARMCFEQFLLSDMEHSGAGVLPPGVHDMHKAELEGPFVLQVDEVINICSPLRERYHEAPAGHKRCLKLSMTDGVQRVYGMEYRPIKELQVLSPAGFKGILIFLHSLKLAMEEIKKFNGKKVEACPAQIGEPPNAFSLIQVIIHNVQIRRGLLMLVPEILEVLGGLVENLETARQRLVDEVKKPPRGKRKQGPLPLSRRASLAAWPPIATSNSAEVNISIPQRLNNPQPTAQYATSATTDSTPSRIIIEEFEAVSTGGFLTEEVNVQHAIQRNAECSTANQNGGRTVDEPASGSRPDIEPTEASCTVPAVDAVLSGVAVGEAENPIIISTDKEIPFTYMAALSAKWRTVKDTSSYIQGNIKCFLTGVKGFQFRQRITYDLQVYIDDGSLISEVLIDHHVVQRSIGHSPQEVNAALSSSDKKVVTGMRECMKRFQLFLAKFEGTMLMEINKHSHLPVALEMNEGCSTSDAWLLLRRLQSYYAQ